MRLPNLLATPKGRLAAFFLLYVTEGIPLGFAATAVATQLRRLDVGPAEIGAFVASFYLPWAFKWAFGPVIDVFGSQRFGRRRVWILGTQILMVATLLSTVMLELPGQLGLFTAVLLLHNSFAAMQDVAIDALAVNSLKEDERGLANGLMFGGAYLGQAIGGAGVLFLAGVTGFQPTFFFVAGAISLVTTLVVWPMDERVTASAQPGPVAIVGSKLAHAGREMKTFAVSTFRSFVGTRGAFNGLWFCLLPPGAMALGLALQSSLAVELGMRDDQIANLNLWCALTNAACCVLGGRWSDRYGRRRTLFVYIAGMSLPIWWLGWELARLGWIMPVSATMANRPEVPAALVTSLWITSIVYNVFQGLMYGTRAAIMMDVTNPRVAATQFTAYMAMMNLAIAYSAQWQGIAAEAFGYPRTLLIDGLYGLLCLVFLPFLKARPGNAKWTDEHAAGRARGVALGLALALLAWVPLSLLRDDIGVAMPIVQTLFTLVFVAAAVFLLAGAPIVAAGASQVARTLARSGVWLAPLLLAMVLRHHVDAAAASFGAGFVTLANALLLAVPVLAAAVLLGLARGRWDGLAEPDANAASEPPARAAA
ncbi:MAG TPA: MFS transporter [Methylibium sp.]|uniref:MFS transporter n=1 Tax=Methylibium sp. TaxID=2067992 RepID=UPI002DB6579A|nr:MFS transporter [Methylibium sp.]HEU4458583.1 MFS transporter [Methylibium sp.]